MQAHEKGLKVWGLLDNFSGRYHRSSFKNQFKKRQNLENQLITYALKAGLDGINVDFESLGEEAGIHFLRIF